MVPESTVSVSDGRTQEAAAAAPAAAPASRLLGMAAGSAAEARGKVGRMEGRRAGEGKGMEWERLSWTAPWFVQEPCWGTDHPSDRGKEPHL